MSLKVPFLGRWAGSHLVVDTRQSMFGVLVASTAVAWGTANRAIYVPVTIPTRVVARKLAVSTGSTGTGNMDIGIYDAAGTRLVSAGSTVKGTSAQYQVVDTADVTLGPGLYYLALNNDSTTDTFICQSAGSPLPASLGVLTEAVGSVTLPASATWAIDQTLTFIPGVAALLVTEVA